jgi:hypothetical protein
MAASLEARIWGGGNAVFSDLKPGDVFTFPKFPETLYVKGKGGWFFYEGAPVTRRFRTGSGTAVTRLTNA